MIIECPYCSTRFRVDEQRLRGHSLLKCSSCTRVFPIPGTKGPVLRVPQPEPAPPEDNLSFEFDDDDWQDEPTNEPDLLGEQYTLNVEPPSRGGDSGPSEDVVPDDEEWVETEREDEGEEDEEAMRVQLKPVFVFLLLVVSGYATLAWTLRNNPVWTASLAQSLPIIGGQLKHDRLKGSIALENVRGRYEHTKEGKLVFLITGAAVNQSTETLTSVSISLGLFDAADRIMAQEVTTCGNPARAELIRELSIQQVAILKGIKPLEEILVQPGERCPLVSIFLEVPATVSAFSAEVVGASRQT
jgi:predicted Zn finger-like uncharacterized protein